MKPGFTMVPDWLCKMPGIPWPAKALWARLAGFSKMSKDKRVVITQPTLAAELGIAVRQVRYALAQLVEYKLVEVEKRWVNGRWENKYTLRGELGECSHSKLGKSSSTKNGTRSAPMLGFLSSTKNGTYYRELNNAPDKSGDGSSSRPRLTRSKLRQIVNETATRHWADDYARLSHKLADVVYQVTGSKGRVIDQRKRATARAKALRRLHSEKGVSLRRIESVMEWLCAGMQQGLPRPAVDSTSWFATKFHSMEEQMLGERPGDEPSDVAREETQPTADWLADELRRIHRPASGNVGRLIACVHEYAQGESTRLDGTEATVVSHVLRPASGSFASAYARWIARKIESWSKWSGQLKWFYPLQERFMEYLNHCVLESENRHITDVERQILLGEREPQARARDSMERTGPGRFKVRFGKSGA